MDSLKKRKISCLCLESVLKHVAWFSYTVVVAYNITVFGRTQKYQLYIVVKNLYRITHSKHKTKFRRLFFVAILAPSTSYLLTLFLVSSFAVFFFPAGLHFVHSVYTHCIYNQISNVNEAFFKILRKCC